MKQSSNVAVIDIGSNSVRLVVYAARARMPTQRFAQKASCSLAQGLDKTGKLYPAGVRRALKTLVEFQHILESRGVQHVHALATAAVRDAKDGPDFVRKIEKKTGFKVRVLSGAEEARYSALGVIGTLPRVQGVVGDLGGGSLELVSVVHSKPGRGQTFPLGPLRLMSLSSYAAIDKTIIKHLKKFQWSSAPASSFYAVGGSWRALARIHMAWTKMEKEIHGYTASSASLQELGPLLLNKKSPFRHEAKKIAGKRWQHLPYAIRVLEHVLEQGQFKKVVFSGCGVREGYFLSQVK